MDSRPAVEQQKWQTYCTTCCVWTMSRACSPFSLPSSSAGNCGRVGSWLPLTALSSASSAYAPRNSASFPRISSASLSTRATLSPGASARRTMPPNSTPTLLPELPFAHRRPKLTARRRITLLPQNRSALAAPPAHNDRPLLAQRVSGRHVDPEVERPHLAFGSFNPRGDSRCSPYLLLVRI